MAEILDKHVEGARESDHKRSGEEPRAEDIRRHTTAVKPPGTLASRRDCRRAPVNAGQRDTAVLQRSLASTATARACTGHVYFVDAGWTCAAPPLASGHT